MRVKTGELKARLSHYLRMVRESGETVEVCAREEPVAYLVPVSGCGEGAERELREVEEWNRRLRGSGVVLASGPASGRGLPRVAPRVAGDGREDVSSVESIRESRDW